MPAEIHCPHCPTTLSVEPEHFGHHGRCHHCYTKFLIEEPTEPTPSPPPKKSPLPIAVATTLALLATAATIFLISQNTSLSQSKDPTPATNTTPDSPTSEPRKAPANLDYHHHPAFPSDAHLTQIPLSLNQAPRLSPEQHKTLKLAAQNASPIRQIYSQLEAPHATIIPLTGSGRFLHLKFLDNFYQKHNQPDKNSGHCHLHELLLADHKGNLLPNENYQLTNADSIQHHYRGEPPAHMIDGDHNNNWHTALDQTFPYTFSLDLQSKTTPAYLVLLHRGGSRGYPTVNHLEWSLTDSEQHTTANKAATENHLIPRAHITRHDPHHADAAGLISLPAHTATTKDNASTWNLHIHQPTTYKLITRHKTTEPKSNTTATLTTPSSQTKNPDPQGTLSLDPGVHQLSLPTNPTLRALDLVPLENLPHYAKKPTPSHIYQPDYATMHPAIMAKMESLADGHYDLRTSIPTHIQYGRNTYLIITSQEKHESLANLPAFIRHKEARGFRVKIIDERDHGGGTGRTAATNIRNWLVKHHKTENILYVLMLGNPHPEEGDTPYRKVAMWGDRWKSISEIGIDAYRQQNPDDNAYDGYCPTDFYYVDLDADWDLNKNGVLADSGDYEDGGINGQPEVFLGRIPFYGVNEPYGNARDIDNILARIIRYENQAGDLHWRHDMFYAGGGTFNRTLHMFDRYLQHTGANMIRHAHAEDAPFEADVDHYRLQTSIDTQNAGRWGFVYYQEHASPYGIGAMSSGGTDALTDDFPSVFALGGCDVASPEHPNNICHALLRNNAVAVFGGTRSVTGCNGNPWNKHNYYYDRLYFGMSTGELLWTMRGDQAKDRVIGGTNFMINLIGDPSIVPMPHFPGAPLAVSPGFTWNTTITEGSSAPLRIPYEIRNNTTQSKTYTLTPAPGTTTTTKSLTLEPGDHQTFTIAIENPSSLRSGSHPFTHTIASDAHTESRTITVRVEPRQRLLHANFDTPPNFKKIEGKPDPAQPLVTGIHKDAALFVDHESEFRTDRFGHRKSYTITYLQNLTKEGQYDILRLGPTSILVRKGKLCVWKSPGGWSILPRPGSKIYDGPPVTLNQWQRIAVIYNYPANTLILQVGNKETVHPLDYEPHVSFPSTRTQIRPRGNHFALDDLQIFNHPLTKEEVTLAHHQHYIVPRFPLNDGTVHPENLALSWDNPSGQTVTLELATDPNFDSIVFTKPATLGTTLPKLDNGKRYFWRIHHPTQHANASPTMVRHFLTDDTVRPMTFSVKPVKLPNAKVAVSGYNKRLNPFIADALDPWKRDLTFKKVSGPDWLRIYPDGLLFTNYGPTPTDLGSNTFEALITAPDGTTRKTTFTITVEQ